jgi:hypothetical protein
MCAPDVAAAPDDELVVARVTQPLRACDGGRQLLLAQDREADDGWILALDQRQHPGPE